MNIHANTVYVVDDDARIRKALLRLLQAHGFDVLAFASAREFLAMDGLKTTACLVLDVSMPDLGGFALQEHLAKARNLLPIIFLTGKGDIPMSVRAIKAGASDFLTKPVNSVELLRAVRAALAFASERSFERNCYEKLTAREREVMEQVVAGKLNKQIAADLGTSEQNIKIHRGRVMAKMGLVSVADLVRVAERLSNAP